VFTMHENQRQVDHGKEFEGARQEIFLSFQELDR